MKCLTQQLWTVWFVLARSLKTQSVVREKALWQENRVISHIVLLSRSIMAGSGLWTSNLKSLPAPQQTFLRKFLAHKDSIVIKYISTSWLPNIQSYDLIGDVLYSNHHRYHGYARLKPYESHNLGGWCRGIVNRRTTCIMQ